MDPRITSAITTAARLHQQKNYAAAEPIYRQILQQQPRNADALLLLGLLLHETHRNEAAAELLRRAAALQPNHPEIRQTYTGVLHALGQIPQAIAQAREVVRLKPTTAEAHFAVAQLMLQAKDFAGALPYARRAAEIQPDSADIFVNLSRVYSGLNSADQAMAAVDCALKADPNDADAQIDKGQLLQNQGRLDEAIAYYQSGLKSAPKNRSALNNLGACLLIKGHPAEAIPFFEAAALVSPESPKPPNNIGAALKDLGRVDEAIVQFQRAMKIDPAFADAYCNIGGAYASIAEHEKAIAACRETLRVAPDFAGVRSNLLLTCLSSPDLSPAQVLEEHKEFNRRHALPLAGEIKPHIETRGPGRRLRIGYVSPDFREHSIRYFIEPILARHDRLNFEIFAYATDRRRDEVSDRLSRLVDAWHSVAELNDQQLANLIHSHQVDILVDLAGHTSDNRLLTFARKPAPVQVTYLGYPTTTGLTTIDYRLTDAIADPHGADEFYTEKLVRLPNAFFVYGDDATKPLDPALPADRNGAFTFGSFNSFTKINDPTLDAWANILRAVPNSRLLMKARPVDNPSTREKLFAFFFERGIAGDRLDLRPWVTLPEHIAMLGSGIDLMLDTYPYNGHTTSCQCLWMGVPVVTHSGTAFRSRVGETILHHLDLRDFIARDWPEYQRIAVSLATDPRRLRELRPVLRERMMGSPLCDAQSFVRSLEDAFRWMHRSHMPV